MMTLWTTPHDTAPSGKTGSSKSSTSFKRQLASESPPNAGEMKEGLFSPVPPEPDPARQTVLGPRSPRTKSDCLSAVTSSLEARPFRSCAHSCNTTPRQSPCAATNVASRPKPAIGALIGLPSTDTNTSPRQETRCTCVPAWCLRALCHDCVKAAHEHPQGYRFAHASASATAPTA